MADNISVTPGVGKDVKTDQGAGSGAHMQVVKLAVSADGAEELNPADVANGLDVDVTRVQGNVTVVQATPANLRVDASGVPVPVTDNSGSLTVDAPVATPAFVRLSNGAAAVDTIPVSDAGGALSVDDGGGSLTVDGTVAATQSGTWNVAAVTSITNAVHVDDNASSLSVDDGAGSLTVDGAVTGAQGTPAAVANAWPVKLSDGADTAGITTVGAAKALKVDVIQDVGNATKADKGAFVEGADKVVPVAGVYNETPASDPTEDQAAAARITAKRGLHVNLRKNDGTELGTATAPVRTDPTGTTTQPVSGAVTANIGTAGTLLTEAAFQARVNTLGQKVMASSTPVVIASDQSAVPVSGTVTANQGTPNATPWNENLKQVGGDAVVTAAAGVQKVGAVDEAGVAFSDSNPLPVELAPLGRTPVRKAITYAANETAVEIWTPTGGKRFVLTQIIITPTAAGAVLKIFDNTNAAGNMIYQGQPPLGTIVINFVPPNASAAISQILRYTTGAAAGGDFTVQGYEV